MENKEIVKILENSWVSRKRLKEMLNMTDDQAREKLREIRKDLPVINFQDGKGYKISYRKGDINRMIRQEKARANKIYRNIKVLEYWEGKVNECQ